MVVGNRMWIIIKGCSPLVQMASSHHEMQVGSELLSPPKFLSEYNNKPPKNSKWHSDFRLPLIMIIFFPP